MSHSSTAGSTSHTNARRAHGLLMIRLRAQLVYGDMRRKRHKGCQSKEEVGGKMAREKEAGGDTRVLTTENVLSKGHEVTYSPGRLSLVKEQQEPVID